MKPSQNSTIPISLKIIRGLHSTKPRLLNKNLAAKNNTSHFDYSTAVVKCSAGNIVNKPDV